MKHSQAVQEAIAEVLAFGKQTGREKLVALRKDGSVLLKIEGTTDQVPMTDEEHLSVYRDAKIIIHNHPSCGGLSQADFLMAGQHECEVIAVDEDGGWYWTDGILGTAGRTHPIAEILAIVAHSEVDARLGGMIKKDLLSIEEADYIFPHLLGHLYRHHGAIQEYEGKLGKKAQAAMTKYAQVCQGKGIAPLPKEEE